MESRVQQAPDVTQVNVVGHAQPLTVTRCQQDGRNSPATFQDVLKRRAVFSKHQNKLVQIQEQSVGDLARLRVPPKLSMFENTDAVEAIGTVSFDSGLVRTGVAKGAFAMTPPHIFQEDSAVHDVRAEVRMPE